VEIKKKEGRRKEGGGRKEDKGGRSLFKRNKETKETKETKKKKLSSMEKFPSELTLERILKTLSLYS
jgi:hypothetical protein